MSRFHGFFLVLWLWRGPLLAEARLLRHGHAELDDDRGHASEHGMIRVALRWMGSNNQSSSVPISHMPLSFLQTSSDGINGGSSISSTRHPPQMSIFGQIHVGTPPQDFNVAFDTASGQLLLVSSACRDVGCLAHKSFEADKSSSVRAIAGLGLAASSLAETTPETIALSVSTGDAEGELLSDRVCLGATAQGSEVCSETGFVSMTRMSQTPWNIFPYDGIMGLGTVGASLEPRFNFLGNLADKGIMRRNRFAVWIANEDDHEESEITFGDFPSERLGSEILWLPIIRLNEGLWQAAVTDLYVSGHASGSCGGGGCEAMFDTGTAVIGGPSALIRGLLSNLNVQEDCSNYNTLPTLGFGFRMYVLNIERSDYVKRVGDYCYHQFMELDLPGDSTRIVLGNPFMTKYFTIFDRESLQVGLAFSNHKDQPGAQETNAQKASRLFVNVA